MVFSFRFESMQKSSDLKLLIDFIAKQHLNYPNYDAWVQRTEAELASGYKEAILAFADGHLAGDVIYQQCKDNPSFLELKNLRVHPDMRSRDFARFMLKQVEADKSSRYQSIICDARADRPELTRFMVRMGYKPIIEVPLYNSGSADIVLVKPLLKGDNNRLIKSAIDLSLDRAI